MIIVTSYRTRYFATGLQPFISEDKIEYGARYSEQYTSDCQQVNDCCDWSYCCINHSAWLPIIRNNIT